MKNPEQNARRWLRQAEYDLKQAEKSLSDGSFAYAAFFAEQSAQKSLKAYLLYKGKRFIFIHSVGELMKEAGTVDNSFLPLIDSGKRLDRHYIISRYSDALPEPAIPAESYTKNEGEAAGQTVGQFHFHVIPRYNGDTKVPRGGIRWIIPHKAEYVD